LGLEDFDWKLEGEDRPRAVACPGGQKAEVHPGRNEQRYLAYFDAAVCSNCPQVNACSTAPLKRTPRHALRFWQLEMDLALRRQRSAEARTQGQNLRAAAESTMRSVKHPFGNGKLPVRGKPRVSMMMIASAAMTNIRRIHGYQERLREEKRKAGGVQGSIEDKIKDAFVFLWCLVRRGFPAMFTLKLAGTRRPI
jgi:hypothetical protein